MGEILEIASFDWDLYPHQKESVIGHLEGKDVVVATGTGSGKQSHSCSLLSHT